MSIFDLSALSRAIEAKDRSYAFLMLLSDGRFRLTGGYAHGALHEDELTDVERFKIIVLSHYFDLPKHSRPATTNDQDVEAFCCFFVSYLFSSFDYEEKPQKRLVQQHPKSTCWCDVCTRLINAPALKAKKVSKRDKRHADWIQKQVLEEIALSEGITLSEKHVTELSEVASLVEPLALVAYGTQLIQRCIGEHSDPSSLVLWRRFAWNQSGSPKKNFVLTVEEILEAEKLLESRITESTEAA